MHDKWMIPCLYLDQGRAVTGWGQKELFQDGDVKRLSAAYSDGGRMGCCSLIYRGLTWSTRRPSERSRRSARRRRYR